MAAIRESCLVPFLERQLVGASFTDMASRCELCSNRMLASWPSSKETWCSRSTIAVEQAATRKYIVHPSQLQGVLCIA